MPSQAGPGKAWPDFPAMSLRFANANAIYHSLHVLPSVLAGPPASFRCLGETEEGAPSIPGSSVCRPMSAECTVLCCTIQYCAREVEERGGGPFSYLSRMAQRRRDVIRHVTTRRDVPRLASMQRIGFARITIPLCVRPATATPQSADEHPQKGQAPQKDA